MNNPWIIRAQRTPDWACCFCKEQIAPLAVVRDAEDNGHTFGWPRIGGDSANGYEVHHMECAK